MKIHIIIHESFESPGAIVQWAEKKNHTLTYTRLYLFESLPNTIDSIDCLIIMGGPQSPSTSQEECSYFDSHTEIEFITRVMSAGKIVLGICLGAQLIGEALGARFDHSPHREIGVFEVCLTEAGKRDPIFSTFPTTFLVGHWHGDMPGLTQDAEVLAFSVGCPRQIVRYTPKVYGFQCHFEFTSESVEDMIQNCSQDLQEYKNLPYIQDVSTLRGHDYSPINQRLFTFLEYLETN